MKLSTTLLVLAALPLLSTGQTASAAQQDRSSSATPLDYLPALQADYFRHESKSVGRPLHIYVAFPESYAANTSTRYPVVFLLDGDSTFPVLATYHWFLNY